MNILQNLNLRKKFLLITLLVGALPIFLLSAFCLNHFLTGMTELKSILLEDRLMTDSKVSHFYLQTFYGNLSVSGNTLVDQNNVDISTEHSVVDAIGKDLNLSATLFLKENDDFIRISTNIIDPTSKENTRATGTTLSKDSAAYPYVINGENYIGGIEILGEEYLALYEPLKDLNGNIIGLIFLGIPTTTSDLIIHTSLRQSLTTISIISSIVLIFAVAISLFLGRSIRKPIELIVQHANYIADYDLTKDIPQNDLNRKDELGALTYAIYHIKENIKYIVGEVAEVSKLVASSAEQLSVTSSETATATDEIAKTTSSIAESTTSQAHITSNGLNEVRALDLLIDKNHKDVDDLLTTTQNVSTLTKDGLIIIENLFTKTKESTSSTQDVYTTILKTNESCSKISEVSNLIASISDQTNLLALNASIEAARAGEQGRGFAVVADEIRKLAEQTAQSTKSIDALIHTLITDASTAVNTTKQVTNTLNEQALQVDLTKAKYMEIAEAISYSAECVGNLTTSVKAMNTKKVEVSAILEELSLVAESNAAATEQSSAATEEQSASLAELLYSSQALSDLSEELHGLICQFKYDSHSTSS